MAIFGTPVNGYLWFGKYLKALTIHYDLGKYQRTLTMITNFAEYICNSEVAMKQSEKRI